MTFQFEERASDSPYVELIQHGYTLETGSSLRPAESHWHLVLSKHDGETEVLAVGPLSSAGTVAYTEGAEILWIRFRLGVFMPHLPISSIRDRETRLPAATSQRFWLKGSALQLPSYGNADTFIDRLARDEVLMLDPLVNAVLEGREPEISPRTVRHRFLRSTGMTQSQIRQFLRAQQAEALLRRGASILDTVYEAGYFDQSHLVRSLKRWIGYTPTQILRQP